MVTQLENNAPIEKKALGWRIVLTGGGTGGHLTPALALADHLRKHPELEALLYMGSPDRIEAKIVPQEGLAFEAIACSGLPRLNSHYKNPVAFIVALGAWFVQLIKAVFKARKQLQAFKPTHVLATGGYVTAPVLLAAKSLGVPFYLHEPDARPGLVNRLLAPWATGVTVAFEQARPWLKNNHVSLTGNPLRACGLGLNLGQKPTKTNALGFLKENNQAPLAFLEAAAQKPVLVVLGGSQGAKSLNKAVVEALPMLLNHLGLCVFHQCGEQLLEDTQAAAQEKGYLDHPCYWLTPFCTQMPWVWPLATVALCRAGSLTLSELALAQVPAILVPYPYAAANHQWHNAQALSQQGAAWLLNDADLNAVNLVEALTGLLQTPQARQQMADKLAGLARPHAAQAVLSQVLQGAF